MARIKFGKRLKNPFIKRKSSERSNNNDSADDRSTSSYVGNRSVFSEDSGLSNQSSGTSSLDSNARYVGPIDIDSCRKHGKNKKKKGGSSSSSGSRRRNSSSVKQRELPKIVESRASTPLYHHNGGGSYSRDFMPDQMDATEPPPPPAVEYEAFLPEPTSPGAQTVSTINGSDVFERNRSSMSRMRSDQSIMTRTRSDRSIVPRTRSPSSKSPSPIVVEVEYNTADAAEQQSPGAQTVSTINGRDIFERNRSWMPTSAVIPDRCSAVTPKSSNQRKESSSFVTSLGSSRSASPGVLSRIHKRERSGNTRSTNGMLEEAEKLINCDPLERNRTDRSDYYSTKDTISGQKGEATTPMKEKQDKRLPKPSPTSIIHMFESEYPVELDPVESHVEENDADFPQCQDKTTDLHQQQQQPLSSQQEPPPPRQPPTPSATVMAVAVAGSKSKNKKSESLSPQSESELLWIAPPEIHRRSPSKMFNDACNSIKSAVPWDPLTYTSLEDAVAAHAAMLTEGGSVNSAAKKMGGASAADSISATAPLLGVPADCGSVTTSSSRMSSSRSKDCIEPTNKATSKEFLALKKVAEKNEFKKVAFLKKTANGAAVVSPEDATRMTSIEPHENIELQATLDVIRNVGDDKVISADPPGFVATRTRSASPAIDDSPPRSSLNSLFLQDVVAPAPQAASEIVVDVIQSFSYDQDCGMEYSLSDDSCSYLSDIETIGDITICDETTRLLDAHKLYEKDAKTNPNHPSRRKKSNMKVGSRFRRLESCFSRGSEPSSGLMSPAYPSDDSINGCSVKTEPAKQPSNKLTWYDDEVNWDRPFTLRTDESFDASTVTTLDTKGVGGMQRMRIVQYNDVNQLLGDFIKGINKYTACGGGDDVASYDASGQDEI